jgi:DNA-binding transcriptional regulator YhcF (GntR family)
LSLGTIKSNQGLKTEQAKRLLVRHIREQGLRKGDPLLSQNELRTKLNLGAVTISRAVHALAKEGVLKTRPKVGTYVVDPDADGRCGRVIGLASLCTTEKDQSVFYSCLQRYLLTNFQELGCQTVVFQMKPKSKTMDTVSLDYFPGLERSVFQGELDAVVLVANIDKKSWRRLENANMFPYFVGTPTPSPRGAYIDLLQSARVMVQELIDRGCRRPAVAMPSGTLHGDFFPIFCELLKDLEGTNPEQLYFSGAHIRGGHRIARTIIARDPQYRPDGIAIVGDYIGMGLTCELARERLEYFPRLACMVNKYVPLDFPFNDIVFFEVDVQELAHTAVKMVTGWFKSDKIEQEQTWITAKKISSSSADNSGVCDDILKVAM